MLANWSVEIKRERNKFEDRNKGKEDHGNSQQIKLNNFNIRIWDKRKEFLYPISIAMKAYVHYII